MHRVEPLSPAGEGLSPGALGLLKDCVGGRPGERLLIVVESEGDGYFDADAPKATARAARQLGLRVYQTEAPTALADAVEIATFIETLTGFDHVLLFARAGDQIRFSGSAKLPSTTMCYLLDPASLDSAFGTACHLGLCEVKSLIDTAFASAEEVRVSCPRGTDYVGYSVGTSADLVPEVSLKRFPMLVPRPIRTDVFTGRIVLSRFLTGTGSHYYEPYGLLLESDVHAVVAGQRLVRFEGKPREVARINAHYEDIASRYDVDPWFVHSWHAGIHPACRYEADARHDLLRWSGSAFGNPRILHFHTCGNYAPGEISWTVLDPTIIVDGVTVWEGGVLHPERLPGGKALFSRHPRLREQYRSPSRDVGFPDELPEWQAPGQGGGTAEPTNGHR